MNKETTRTRPTTTVLGIAMTAIICSSLLLPAQAAAAMAFAVAQRDVSCPDTEGAWSWVHSRMHDEKWYMQPADKGWEAASLARKQLKGMGYSRVIGVNQTSLSSGHWVIIKWTNRWVCNTTRFSAGFGNTPSGALDDAIESLRNHDWNWEARYGYDVVRQGTF